MNSNGDRGAELEALGRFYGEQHFAITFTAAISGPDAKRVTRSGWDTTRPLTNGDHGAGLVKTGGIRCNPAIVLRPSNLVVLECDTEADLVRIRALNLPETLTVQSSEPYKRHFYFRPPADLEGLPYVAFRFESGKLTADSGRYFLAPPSIHPSGAIYSFLPLLGPDDIDIAELPVAVYRALSQQARLESSELRHQLEVDPEAKIRAGNRGDMIFRYACMHRRWGATRQQIARSCHEFNETRCEPPIERERVETQVDGAMKKQGDQEIVAAMNGNGPTVTEDADFADLGEETPAPDAAGPSIVSLLQFIHEHEEPPEAVIGDPTECLLPQGGLLILAGEGGSSKTTLTLDAVAHICGGTPWLGYPCGRPVRALILENEGPRALFRDKLRAKTEAWQGEDFQHNVYVWESPWAAFQFTNSKHRIALREFTEEHAIDMVIADPLDSLGIEGAGTPENVRGFINLLRECGLHDPLNPLAFWILHHYNKTPGASIIQRLSGAWGGHPDAVLGAELGEGQTTKLTWAKLRHATPPSDKTTILAWDTGSRGFHTIEKGPVLDIGEVRKRVETWVRDHPGDPQSAVEDAVGGGRKTVREALEWLESAEGGKVLAKGPGRAKNGKYYYPSNHAALRSPNDQMASVASTQFELPGTDVLASSPTPP